ncbi:Hypothetical protein LUCI_3069 [Lucifera butyrica]|uniref:Uncharacterized protein n=1 Tax=Lucifera butyrica TaxID=1351585 RepID=A0A498R8G9_9FIRM|nr:Hypothetical protein LUCI_3069 [Lucifera butyrica]
MGNDKPELRLEVCNVYDIAYDKCLTANIIDDLTAE